MQNIAQVTQLSRFEVVVCVSDDDGFGVVWGVVRGRAGGRG